MAELFVPLASGDVALDPLVEADREDLRAACAVDDRIWRIYPFSYAGEQFDPNFDKLLPSDPARSTYAVRDRGTVVGMTAWLGDEPANGSVEIGGTYIAPPLRGSGFNRAMKTLMLDHAFGLGYRRIVFKVDERNTRSQAAVLKLGCTKEGVLRSDRVTWTGFVRDTGVFSILDREWLSQTKG